MLLDFSLCGVRVCVKNINANVTEGNITLMVREIRLPLFNFELRNNKVRNVRPK